MLVFSDALPYDIQIGFVNPVSYNHIIGGAALNEGQTLSSEISGSHYSCNDFLPLMVKITSPSVVTASTVTLTFNIDRDDILIPSPPVLNYQPVPNGDICPCENKYGVSYGLDSAVQDNGDSTISSHSEDPNSFDITGIDPEETIVFHTNYHISCPSEPLSGELHIQGVASVDVIRALPQLSLTNLEELNDCSDDIDCTLEGMLNDMCSVIYSHKLCEDNIDCTTEQCTDKGCISIPNDDLCEDNVECTLNICTLNGCVFQPSHQLCDDQNLCTYDFCVSSGCVNDPISCDDGIRCTVDSCDSVIGCTYDPQDAFCDDNSQCTVDSCSISQGCVYTDVDCVCSDWSNISECKMEKKGWFKSRVRTCDCATQCGVITTSSEPCRPSECTYNTNYWKANSKIRNLLLQQYGINADSTLLTCGNLRWGVYSAFFESTYKYPGMLLAQEYLSSLLNRYNGVNDDYLENAIAATETYFDTNLNWCEITPPNSLYYAHVYVNEGMTGPGNCIKPTCYKEVMEGPCIDGERDQTYLAVCTNIRYLKQYLADCSDCGTGKVPC